jgi:hypothetical protein
LASCSVSLSNRCFMLDGKRTPFLRWRWASNQKSLFCIFFFVDLS